jgi:CheY-like chemotaxis protein
MINLGRKMPDLLITDLNMLGINGFDLVKYLKTSLQFNQLDIAVITALTPDDLQDTSVFPSTVQLFLNQLILFC